MFKQLPVCGCALLLATSLQSARADLPFLKDIAGDAKLPPSYGIGIDLFTMNQDYNVNNLDFSLPGLVIDDPSIISVENDIDYADVKLDAWIFPFLNVFAVLGTLDGETSVNLSGVALP